MRGRTRSRWLSGPGDCDHRALRPWPADGGGSGRDAAVLQSIGPLTFGPDDVLFAADTQAAAIYALDLGAAATGGAPGTRRTCRASTRRSRRCSAPTRAAITVTDLAVHPKTRNAFVSVMRGQGADAKPALRARRRRRQARRRRPRHS